MATIRTTYKYKCDLDKGTLETTLRNSLMQADALADAFAVTVQRNGKDVDISGMTVYGYLYASATKTTVPLKGTVSGSTATVILSEDCYAVPGYASLMIQLHDGDVRHTVLKVDFVVTRTGGTLVLDGDNILPTLAELLGQISAMEQATAEAREAAANADAAREGIQGDLAALTEDIAEQEELFFGADRILGYNDSVSLYLKNESGGRRVNFAEKIPVTGGSELLVNAHCVATVNPQNFTSIAFGIVEYNADSSAIRYLDVENGLLTKVTLKADTASISVGIIIYGQGDAAWTELFDTRCVIYAGGFSLNPNVAVPQVESALGKKNYFVVNGHIEDGVDANDMTDSQHKNIAYAANILNFPFGAGQRRGISVYKTSQYSVEQVAYNYTTGEIGMRIAQGDPLVWNDWHVTPSKSSVNPLKKNTNVVSGFYNSTSSAKNNVGAELTLLQYNMARYNPANIEVGGIAAEDLPSKLVNLKKFLMMVNSDIIGMQEDGQYVDLAHTMDAKTHLFYPMYNKSGTASVTLASKRAFATQEAPESYSNGREIKFCTIDVNGKTLLVATTHPIYGATDEAVAKKLVQYTEMFEKINSRTWDYCIVFGDFNSETDADKTNLKNLCEANGFTMANGGYLGWIDTVPENKQIDNILCSSNIVINNVQVYDDLYDDLCSDHYPMSACVTLIE